MTQTEYDKRIEYVKTRLLETLCRFDETFDHPRDEAPIIQEIMEHFEMVGLLVKPTLPQQQEALKCIQAAAS